MSPLRLLGVPIIPALLNRRKKRVALYYLLIFFTVTILVPVLIVNNARDDVILNQNDISFSTTTTTDIIHNNNHSSNDDDDDDISLSRQQQAAAVEGEEEGKLDNKNTTTIIITNSTTTTTTATSSIASSANNNKNITLWCVLDSGNLNPNYRHFPHTLEMLAPCWSYFCQERRKQQLQQQQYISRGRGVEIIQNNSSTTFLVPPTIKCGFYFNFSKEEEKFNYKQIDLWARHLILSMKCTVLIHDKYHHHHQNNNNNKDDNDRYYRRNRTGSKNWFQSPEDVELLQPLVFARRKQKKKHSSSTTKINGTTAAAAAAAALQSDGNIDDEYNMNNNNNNSSNRHINIGILQRYPNVPQNKHNYREFANIQEMKLELQNAFPNATINVDTLKGKLLPEQAWWFHTNDIIIAAHGAAMANIIFVQLNIASTVIEIFPTGYTPYMFQSLMKNIGINYYRIDNATSKTNIKKSSNPRNAALEPNITHVVELVQKAILRRQEQQEISSTPT